jgi:conjugal transfer pilus assembly protein TraB
MNISLSRATLGAHQRLIFKSILGFLLMGAILLVFLGQEPRPSSGALETPGVSIKRIPEDKNFWIFKAENQLEEQSKRQKDLSKEIEDLKAVQQKQYQEMEAQAQRLSQSALEAAQEVQEPKTMRALASSESSEEEEQHQSAASSIFSETIAVSVTESVLPHIDSFIPAGTYVKAVLLNGLDISAGISSQANPQPVLLRLVDLGSLPNHAKNRLKDCRVIAAAHGELSNERVNMRLEKLSCVQEDGHVIESEVSGFVNGLDGKNGVRGKVVLRDAEVLKRGFMGGLLSGLSKASLGSKEGPSAFGAMDAKGSLNLFKNAGMEGTGDAFELMAKYNIQRAEQYQPVLQVSAGSEVDVVFHAGTPFGFQKRSAQASNKALSLEGVSP